MIQLDIMIRTARIGDIPQIRKIVDYYARQGKLLPRSREELEQTIPFFWVINEDKTVLGCTALVPYSQDLAEIRSLAVQEQYKKQGKGRELVEKIQNEAKKRKIKTVFVFTYTPVFFEKLGFKRIDSRKLPEKYWRDCHECPKYSSCDEVALIWQSF